MIDTNNKFWMDRIYALTIGTFHEVIRSKVLFLILFFSLAVVSLSSFFGAVSIGDQIKIMKDFGLFSVSLFSVLFCVIAGATLLQKELARKTIYNILGKAVHRWEFVAGKFLGLVAVATVLVLGMGIALSGYIALFEGKLSFNLMQAYYFLVLEVLIIGAASMFFSAIVVTPILSGLFTFFFFIAGRSSQYLLELATMTGNPIPKIGYWLLPHLDLLYIGNEVVYGVTRTPANVAWSTVYACAYSMILLVVAIWFFARKDFN